MYWFLINYQNIQYFQARFLGLFYKKHPPTSLVDGCFYLRDFFSICTDSA